MVVVTVALGAVNPDRLLRRSLEHCVVAERSREKVKLFIVPRPTNHLEEEGPSRDRRRAR